MTEDAEAAGGRTLRVLIADENPASRRFLTRVVRDSFLDEALVVECSDTAAAIDLLDPGIDLVLVDQQLPEGGAVEVLRQHAGHPALKVITTLYSDDERLFDLIRLGAAGYLLKEDRFEVQVEQLQRIAKGVPPLSPAIARCALAALGSAALLASPGEGPGLEPEESDVLHRVSRGYTLREVSNSLSLRPGTVMTLIASIYRKLQVAATATPEPGKP